MKTFCVDFGLEIDSGPAGGDPMMKERQKLYAFHSMTTKKNL